MAKTVTLSDDTFTMLSNVVEGRLTWYRDLLTFPESEPGKHEEIRAKITRMEETQRELGLAEHTEKTQ